MFERARNPGDIPPALLAVREEYARFRRELRSLEEQRPRAGSIKERVKVLNQMRFFCAELSKPFTDPSLVTLTSTLRMVPELALNPTEPAKWVKTLLGKPADALVLWYRRRPVSKLRRTAKQVSALPPSDTLIQKHFEPEAAAALHGHLARRSPPEQADAAA